MVPPTRRVYYPQNGVVVFRRDEISKDNRTSGIEGAKTSPCSSQFNQACLGYVWEECHID